MTANIPTQGLLTDSSYKASNLGTLGSTLNPQEAPVSFCASTTLGLLPRAWMGVFTESQFAHSPASQFPLCQGPSLRAADLLPLEEAKTSSTTKINISLLASLPRPESPGVWDRGKGADLNASAPKQRAGEGGDSPPASSNYISHQEIHL